MWKLRGLDSCMIATIRLGQLELLCISHTFTVRNLAPTFLPASNCYPTKRIRRRKTGNNREIGLRTELARQAPRTGCCMNRPLTEGETWTFSEAL